MDESVDIAVGRALVFLGSRDRSCHEVLEHLRKRGFAHESSAGAVERLKEMGYLDDVRFAQAFCSVKREVDGWGDERIRMRLAELGVPRDSVDSALSDSHSDSELERALRLLERRLSGPVDDEGGRRRAMGILVRRGYSPELAADAIRAHSGS